MSRVPMTRPALFRRGFDRRKFLGGLGAAGLVVPYNLKIGKADAAGRKTVVIFYVGGGINDPNWYQGGRETGAIGDKALTGSLAQFDTTYQALRNKLTVIEGAHGLWTRFPSGSALFAHDRSTQCALDCTNPDDKETNPSLDRRFAAHLKTTQDVPFASLMLGPTRGWKYTGRGEISRNGDAALSTLLTDPVKTYERVFMGFSAPSAKPGEPPSVAAETARTIEKGILSAAMEQCAQVKKQAELQLGKESLRKVSDQCDALRDMEKRLSTALPSSVRCTVPDKLEGTGFGKAATFFQTMDAFRRLGANALACGRTNVVLVEVWRDQPDEQAVFQPAEFQKLIIHLWHFHKNNGSGGTLWLRARQDLDNRIVEEFAKWSAEMDRQQLLDDGLVVWTTNEPRGDHSINGQLPLFYTGSLGGKLRTGRYVRLAPSTNFSNSSVVPSANEVYATMLRAAGLNTELHGPKKYHRTGTLVDTALRMP